ncbi:MAG: hypothetical protein JW760_07290, partial [Spirochaetales bacterium]|nr:hypothetical protein [Spirochaetales bacterium]
FPLLVLTPRHVQRKKAFAGIPVKAFSISYGSRTRVAGGILRRSEITRSIHPSITIIELFRELFLTAVPVEGLKPGKSVLHGAVKVDF